MLQTARRGYDKPPLEPAQLKEYVNGLWEYALEDVVVAIQRCKKEVVYGWPSLADICTRIEGKGDAVENAAARAGFELAMAIAKRHASNDSEGRWALREVAEKPKRYVADDGSGDEIYYSKKVRVPAMPDAVEYAVRMSGGWGRLATLEVKEWPFYQKEFFGHFNGFVPAQHQSRLTAQATGQLSGGIKGLVAAKVMP